ncbi:RodZ domain-containing protein [Shewanella gaetbuli]|uniref:DUF4115 domain-containing protein n=1 Tax=Shewanella gaetbuli TaxID=220752 RepID=A0A9X1ZL42_9GAMM|nr:RodZ domain-containing protein [Shewanella gaetbuli]MCL1141757.1 DUF4115 domain-containing protein [Shewanella gaetbuli]
MTKEQLEEQISETTNDLNNIATVGAILRTARENKGITIESVALHLHLRPTVLTDIEADNFDNIASNTYARGYIKNYARYVEADVDAIALCLNQQIPEHVPPTMQSFSRKTTRQARDSRLNLVTYVIGFILVAMLVLWWVQKSELLTHSNFALPTVEEMQADETLDYSVTPQVYNGSETLNTQPTSLTEVEVESTPADERLTKPTETIDDNAIDGDSSNLANESATPVNEVVAVSTEPTSLTSTDAQATYSQVSMSFTADCWINVVDVTGKVLADGVKKAGHQFEASGQAPFKLIIGAPQAVTLSFNGEPVNMSQYGEGRVARLTLSEDN